MIDTILAIDTHSDNSLSGKFLNETLKYMAKSHREFIFDLKSQVSNNHHFFLQNFLTFFVTFFLLANLRSIVVRTYQK